MAEGLCYLLPSKIKVAAFKDFILFSSGAKENLRDYSGHFAGHYLNIKEEEGPEGDCELRESLLLSLVNYVEKPNIKVTEIKFTVRI